METPLVSVCMTTYNHEAYLRQAVESILAQETSFDVELVLGDDCSADSTAAICREYAAKYPGRVRFVTGERNVGWRANYRRTFEACRGKYVAYCDGDDWWSDPRKLQMQADLLESDPSCGMCYTRQQLLPEHRPHRTRSRGALYRLRPPALPAHHRQLRHAGAPRPHRPLLCRGTSRRAPRMAYRRRPDVALVRGLQPCALPPGHHGGAPPPAAEREP